MTREAPLIGISWYLQYHGQQSWNWAQDLGLYFYAFHLCISWRHSKELCKFFLCRCADPAPSLVHSFSLNKWNAHSPRSSENIIEFATIIWRKGSNLLQQQLLALVLFLMGFYNLFNNMNLLKKVLHWHCTGTALVLSRISGCWYCRGSGCYRVHCKADRRPQSAGMNARVVIVWFLPEGKTGWQEWT